MSDPIKLHKDITINGVKIDAETASKLINSELDTILHDVTIGRLSIPEALVSVYIKAASDTKNFLT